MTGIFKHIFLLLLLAAVCYVIAIAVASGRIGFIVFLAAGLLAELVFWVLFWRQRADSRRRRAHERA